MNERNELYPVFLKVHELQVLIVGAGNVGLEKLSFLLKSSPNAKVQIVAPQIKEEIQVLAQNHQLELITDVYQKVHIIGKDLVIAATDNTAINEQIYRDCKASHTLINVADTPHLCDFYLGGIVTKGNVKIAISTNGKSPTTAKRLRQFFEAILPEDINVLVQNLHQYRKKITGDFEHKVQELNQLTESLIQTK